MPKQNLKIPKIQKRLWQPIICITQFPIFIIVPEDNYFGSNMIVHLNFQSIKFEYSRSTLFQNLIIGLI